MSGLQDILSQEKSSIEDSKTINDFDYVERKYAKPKKEEQQSIQPKAETQNTNTENEDTSSVIDYAKEQLAHPIDNMALPLAGNVGVGALQAISGTLEAVAHPYDLTRNISGVFTAIPRGLGEVGSILGFDTIKNYFNRLDEMDKVNYENEYGNYQNNAFQNVLEAVKEQSDEYSNNASQAINSIKSQGKAKATIDGVAGFVSDLENLIPQVVGQLGGASMTGLGAENLVGKVVANSKVLTSVENKMLNVTKKISDKLSSKLPESLANKIAIDTAGKLLSRTSGYTGQMATYLGMSQDELKNTFENSYNNLTSSQIETSEMFKYLQDKYKTQYPNATDEDIYNKSMERFKSIYLDMCNSQLASNGLSMAFDVYGDKLALRSLLKGSIIKNALGEGIAEGGQNLFAQKAVVDTKNRLGIVNNGIDMEEVVYNAGLGAGVGIALGTVGSLNKTTEQQVSQPTQSIIPTEQQNNKNYSVNDYLQNNTDQQGNINSIRLVEDVNKNNVDENGRRIKPSQRKTKDVANVETGIEIVSENDKNNQYKENGYETNKDAEDISNITEDITQEEINKYKGSFPNNENNIQYITEDQENIDTLKGINEFSSTEEVFNNAIDTVDKSYISSNTKKIINLYRKNKSKFLDRYKGMLQQQINDLKKTPLNKDNKKEVNKKINDLKNIVSSNESLDNYIKTKILDAVMTDNVNAYNNVSNTDANYENKRANLRNEFDKLQYGLNVINFNTNNQEQAIKNSGYNVSFDENGKQTGKLSRPEIRTTNNTETQVNKIDTTAKNNNQNFKEYIDSLDKNNLTDKTNKQLEDYTNNKDGYIKKYISNVKRKITNLTKKDKLTKAEQKELSRLNKLAKLGNKSLADRIEKDFVKQIESEVKQHQNNNTQNTVKTDNIELNNTQQSEIESNNNVKNESDVVNTQEENNVNNQIEQSSDQSLVEENIINPTEDEKVEPQTNKESLTEDNEEEPQTLAEREEYLKNNGNFHKQIQIEKQDYIKEDQFDNVQNLHKEMVSKAKELFNVKNESELPPSVKVHLDNVKDNIEAFKNANKNIVTNYVKTITGLYNSIVNRELNIKTNKENRQGKKNTNEVQTKQNAEIKKLNIQTDNKNKANKELDKDIKSTEPEKITPAEKGKITKVLNKALNVLDPYLDGDAFNLDKILNSSVDEKTKAGYQNSLTKLSKTFNELSNYIKNNKEYNKQYIAELVKDINDNIERYNKYQKDSLGETRFKRVTNKNGARSNDSVIYTEQQTTNKPLDKHIQEKEVKQFLENYIKDKPILRNVEVVLLNNDQETVDSLNDIGIKLENGSIIAGYFDAVANKVYLNSSRIANTTELKQMLFHEIVGHYGFNKVLTQEQRNEFSNLMDQVVSEEQLSDLAELYGNDKFLLHEELLADYIANRETSGKLGKAWNKVKNFIDKILSKWFGKNTKHNVLESAYQSIVDGMSSGIVNNNLHNSIARDTSIKYKKLANKIISNPRYNAFLPFRSDTEFYEQFKDNEYVEPIINIYTKTKEAFTVIRHRLQNNYGKVVALNRNLLQEVTDAYNKANPKDKKHVSFFERQLGKFQNDMTIARFGIEDIEIFIHLNKISRKPVRPGAFIIGTNVYNHLNNVLHDKTVGKEEKEKAQKEFDDLENKFVDLVDQYKKLDTKQIQLYKENRDLYATQMNDVIEAYKEFVRQSGGTSQSNLTDPNDPNSKTKLEQIIEDLEGIVDNQIGDYFPLARFGKYKLDYANKNGERVVKMFTSKTVANTSIDLIKKSGDYHSIKELELEKIDDVKTFENTIDLNELDAEISRINEVNGMISKSELEKRLRDFVLNKVSDTSAEQFLLRERDRVLGADESLIMTMQNRANTIANFAATLRVQHQRNLNAIDRRWQENALEVITKIKQKDALDVLRTWADHNFNMSALNHNERKIFDVINSENKLQRMYPDKYINLIDEEPDREVYETVRKVNREISLREEMLAKMRNEKPLNEILGITSAVNYAITLGGNLSSATLNLSQIVLLTLPHVTGKCGYINAVKGLSKMMKNYYYVYNSSRAWKDVPKEIWRTGSEKPVVSITRTLRDLGNSRTPEQEKNYRILQHLTEHDIIGSNLVNELNIRKNRVDDLVGNITVGLKNKLGLIESENDIAKTKSKGIINGLNNMISSAFSICDALSKEGSALLSYYAYESANPKATEEEKIDYMLNSVKQTQFEYRKSMKGWGMNVPYIQPFMTFATYPVGMMSFYLNNWGHLLQGLKSGNTEQRNEATKKLMTFTVMGLATGGLSSTGLDTLFLFLLGLLQDDDDPDYMGLASGKLSMGQILKGEKAMKEWGHIGKILDKGLLSYLTNIDFSSRLQFEPGIKINIRKLAHENNIWEALGKSLIMPSVNKAIPNIGSFVADMFDDVTAGNIGKMGDDVLKFMRTALFIDNVYKAIDISKNGKTYGDKNRKLMPEDYSTYEAFMQMFGFRSLQLSNLYDETQLARKQSMGVSAQDRTEEWNVAKHKKQQENRIKELQELREQSKGSSTSNIKHSSNKPKHDAQRPLTNKLKPIPSKTNNRPRKENNRPKR